VAARSGPKFGQQNGCNMAYITGGVPISSEELLIWVNRREIYILKFRAIIKFDLGKKIISISNNNKWISSKRI